MNKVFGVKDKEEVKEFEEVAINEEETKEADTKVALFSLKEVMEYANATNTDLTLFDGEYSTLSELHAVVVAERARKVNLQESTTPPNPNTTTVNKPTNSSQKTKAYEAAITKINNSFMGD